MLWPRRNGAPCPTSQRHASPHPAQPCSAIPNQTGSSRGSQTTTGNRTPFRTSSSFPCRAAPNPAGPRLALSRHALPCPTQPRAPLKGPDRCRESNPHTEIDDINVIDTRAREVIRSMLQRLDRLEAAQATADPFDGVPPRSDAQ